MKYKKQSYNLQICGHLSSFLMEGGKCAVCDAGGKVNDPFLGPIAVGIIETSNSHTDAALAAFRPDYTQ